MFKRCLFVAVFVCVAVVANAQDLSKFEKKGARIEVKTECFVQNFTIGDKEERLAWESTKNYDLDGDLRKKTEVFGKCINEYTYRTDLDDKGRVSKRTELRETTIGSDPPHRWPLRVWGYTYDDAGAATVVCKEVIEEKNDDEDADDPDRVKELPIVEKWELDSSGRVLRYFNYLGDRENWRVIFERDKDGKLLKREQLSGELLHSRETYVYRDDGTLKESDDMHLGAGHTKKQYDAAGKESGGQKTDMEGEIWEQWTVKRSACGKLADGGSQDTTTYTFCGEDKDKVESQVRYVVTTKQYK